MNKPKIFIIEDDPVFAKILEKRLHNGGFYETRWFRDGQACLESMKKGAQPKFVFLDFTLITFNGLDVLIRIKEIFKSTKVIIVTQLVTEGLERKCLNAGATYYIHKDSMLEKFPDHLLELLWPDKGFLYRRGKRSKAE